ncbi:MAG TPA: CRISPR-associated protein Cas4 [Candidatus Nitrosotenuis sp.]|nr:CRISPR-associated protein Cas4 [Candidatus Nitrosotenuis sp.]
MSSSSDNDGSEYSFTDAGENTISVTDIKHYFYCPKIIYFDKVMHADAVLNSQQEAAKKTHKEKEKKDKRRKTMFYDEQFPGCQKLFRLHMFSASLGLEGIADCVIVNGRERIPVDYKRMFSKGGEAWTDHRFQLAAYALLLEEQYSTIVRRGFVYYLPEDKVVEVEITESMKTYLKKAIRAIHNVVEGGEEPSARIPRSRCTGGCGYLWICGGIWNRKN